MHESDNATWLAYFTKDSLIRRKVAKQVGRSATGYAHITIGDLEAVRATAIYVAHR